MYSVQLEIDMRTLRYVGHVSRMPQDRWEYMMLFGRVQKDKNMKHQGGKDIWWNRVRMLLKQVMTHSTGDKMWYEIAKDAENGKQDWRDLCKIWREARVAEERRDTQKSREDLWLAAAKGFKSSAMAELIWDGVKDPNASGTPLEDEPLLWLKLLILAGGVAKSGWMEGVDRDWRWAVKDEASQAWLRKEGDRVRMRLRGKGWADKIANIPTDQQLPDWVSMLRRHRFKQPAGQPVMKVFPMAPPPRPPAGGAVMGAEPEAAVGGNIDSILDAQGRKRCECGSWIKPISWNQHLKSYCPLRVFGVTETRGGRKIIRPVPPAAPRAVAPDADVAGKAKPDAPKPAPHVRWAAAKIQPKRNASSIPGERGDEGPKSIRGPSQAPPPPATEEGCYGSCALCNQCSKCRRRLCNGGCVGCSLNCRK
jgi:hypothetical protein